MEKHKKNIIFAATFLMWFSIYTYQSNFTPYMQDTLKFTPSMAGLVVGSYGFVQMVLRIPLGIFSDKLKTRKLFIILGLAFTFISALLLFVSDSFILVLIARAGAGVAASAWVNFIVLFSSYYDKDKTVSAAGTLTFFNNIGQLCGILCGSLLVSFTLQKDKSAFLLAVFAGLAAFACSFLIYEDREKINIPKTREPAKFTELLTNKPLIAVSLIGAVSQLITFSTIFGFTPAYAKNILGTSEIQNGLLMIFSYIPTALGALFLGRFLAGRIKEYKLVTAGMLILGVTTILIPFTYNYGTLLVTQVIAGFGKGVSFPLLMGLSIKKIQEHKRGAAMGIFQAVYSFGMFFGPFITGLINENFELGAAFIFIGAVCFVFTVISYFSLKKLDF
ncbi:MAG: MFS transporter [Oscillospiraceae bacterium]|nr:MFS transporter [Oscillospiraceae bacterium]